MTFTRRQFLGLLPVALLARPVRAMGVRVRDPKPKHPTPRPGITAAKVLPDTKLTEKDAAPVYAMVRTMPEIVDGIRCNCGCADLEGFYSLLTCYEQDGMAQHCRICQGQARLAHKLHADGMSLNAIRRAIDAEFGDR
jgi:hypothetical protein